MPIYPAETIFPSGSLYPEKIGTGFDFPFGNIYNRVTSREKQSMVNTTDISANRTTSSEKQSISNSVNSDRFHSSENRDNFVTSTKRGFTSNK